MSSKHIRGDVNLAWPTAENRGDGARGRGEHPLPSRNGRRGRSWRLQRREDSRIREKFANPYIAAERGYVDESSCRRDTRPRLAAGLAVIATSATRIRRASTGNIPL